MLLRGSLLLLLFAALSGQDPPAPSFANLGKPAAGMPAMPSLAGAPPSEAVFELGRRLFADPILSVDRTVSCQSCHLPQHGFAHPDPLPPGSQGKRAKRHAPTLFNRAWGRSQRWDGSVATLEDFVLQPIADANEMGLAVEVAVQRLGEDAHYAAAFRSAFATDATAANLSAALATFVRGITAPENGWDRFHAGNVQGMDQDARAGMWIFESKGACWKCHTPGPFTDEDFHATGIAVRDGQLAEGRLAHTHDAADRGRFKTPTLRQIRLTPPYMHDGSVATLAEVIEFYDRGGNAAPGLDARLQPLHLTTAEKAQLLAFLQAL